MPPVESRFGQIGPYQLERAIARTAQALLYQAKDVRTGQEAAVKVALPTLDRALFRQEKSLLARLKHPNIVSILDSGMTSGDGSLWYAMEFVRGGTLSDLAKSVAKPAPGVKRRVDPAYIERVEFLTEKVCGALGHLHLQGLVHGDVKPDNILVREDGTPVLIDFGAATEFAATGRDRFKVDAHITGTAAYMAPEQIRGDFVDARVDLYALGCVLFELVCGRPPFVGSRQECIAQHLGSDAPPVHHYVEGVPDHLSELIERLLQKRPKQRIGYADDVVPLLRTSRAEASFSGLPYLHRSDFYGQADALSVVERAFEGILDAPAGLILVSGDSGMGKTRFLLEASQLAQRQGLNLLTAECRELLSSSDRPNAAVDAGPLHPFERVLEDWADLTIHQLSLNPDTSDPVAALAPLFPVVAQVFGINSAAETATNEAFRLRTAMLHVLRRLAVQGPTVLAIDDVHWADPLSLGVLRELLGDAALSLPLLCICTVRREHQAQVLARLGHGESGSSPRVRTLELELLSRGQTADVVSDLLGVEAPDHTIVDAVYRVSEGQPFMVGELLRSAIAKEVVVRNDSGAWGVKRTNEEVVRALELEIPRSLESLIAQRCADLSPQANRVLRVASALGRDFRQDVVSRITSDLSGHDHAEILLGLEELVRRQVLVKSESEKYRFVHDRLRELPYMALSDSERRRIHLHAAATLEAMGAGASPPMDATSAGLHWSRVGVHDRAAACFGRAADAARVAFAHEQAVAMYEAALRELDDTEDPPAPLRSRLWEGLGDVLLRVGDNEKAEQALRGAVDAFPELSVPRRAELMQKIARTLQNRFMAQAALDALRGAEAVLENAPGHRELYASIQIERAWIHYWHGEVAEMEVALAKVPESVEQTFGPELQTRYFEVLTLAGFRREKYRVTAQTVDAARRALAAARLTRDTQALMTSQWMLGLALLFAGDLQGAEPALTQSAELASKRGDAKHERATRAYLALVYRLRGDVQTVRDQCEALLSTAPTGLLAVWTALSDANLGWTSLRLGEFDEARTHLDKARAFWRSMPSPYPLQWTGLLPYLELQLRQGETEWVDTARQLLDEALHPLPDPIATALNEALRCEAAQNTELAIGCAWKAVDLSRSRGLA
jgi:serine/threonine protein kinase/tetratricopeptide (TPR) repeat protein